MRKTNGLSLIATLAMLLYSCSVMQNASKEELADGFYQKKTGSEKKLVYVNVVDETVLIYPTVAVNDKTLIDTLSPFKTYSPVLRIDEELDFTLSRNSFDLDFLTIPLKFRAAESTVPAQLNSTINGAVFLGYRMDKYRIKYALSPLHTEERKSLHFGYSLGVFAGLGNTFMSPTTTNNRMQQEYNGIVWGKGIAGIMLLNDFTLGLTLGVDNLLDKNRDIWVYENKPWIGLGVGLHLN